MNVSVIMATYNREALLPALLEQWQRIQKNSKYTFELLFSDDESSDGTVAFLEQYQGLPLRVLRNPHGGAGRARNHAYREAVGELIIFTGDDIFPEEDFINKHYEYYLKHGPKTATLGRIEWKEDIHETYLMHHITKVGCEQFGFVGLIPFSEADFRHFYTSNISVAKAELDKQDVLFDERFDKCNFEDIELGYRLYKNGLRIFYAPDALAYHDHVYSSTKQFIKRQLVAGDHLEIFVQVQPSLKESEIKVDIHGFQKGFEDYCRRSGFDLYGRLGMIALALFKPAISILNNIIEKTNEQKAKTVCSKLYSRLFSVYFFAGLAGHERGVHKREKTLRYAFRYVNSGFMQLFYAKTSEFKEEMSVKVRVLWKGRQVRQIDIPNEGIRRIRFDPYNGGCKVKHLSIAASLADGSETALESVYTNSRDGKDFSKTNDPIFIFEATKADIQRVSITMDLIPNSSIRARRALGAMFRFFKQVSNWLYRLFRKRHNTVSSQDCDGETYPAQTASDSTSVSFPLRATMENRSMASQGQQEAERPQIQTSPCTQKSFALSSSRSLVSVVIPSYNHERFLQQAIDSVLNQTHKDLELIIIDDGSRDDSPQILSKLTDPRCTVVFQENAGAHNAINRGLALAQGDYLAVLNSDDMYHPLRLEKCIAYLEGLKETDLVATYIEVIDSNGTQLGIKEGWRNLEPWPLEHPAKSYAVMENFTLNAIASNFVSSTSNMVFRRSLYGAIGGMRNLRFAHDWDFLLRTCEQGTCHLLEEPLLQYRVHGGNTISKSRGHMLFEICWIYAVHLPLLSVRAFPGDTPGFEWFSRLHHSTNLQGNDKVLWEMLAYLCAQRQNGITSPEERLLDDAALRDQIISLIVE